MTLDDQFGAKRFGVQGVALKLAVDLNDPEVYADLRMFLQGTSSTQGMAFDTSAGRNTYFAEVERNPSAVSYGAALSHACATNIGIWGDRERLYRDCARVMAAELRRLQGELKREVGSLALEHPFCTLNITPEAVEQSTTFRNTYETARAPRNAELHNLVRALGSNRERLQRRIVVTDLVMHSNPLQLYVRILNDIYQSSGKRVSADTRTRGDFP